MSAPMMDEAMVSTTKFPMTPTFPMEAPPSNFHTHLFPDGSVMPGLKEASVLQTEADIVFAHDVRGRTVLDIGAWDGFFSFEAERRGAARVLATDHFCWTGPGWGTRQGFEYAHRKFNSKVEALDIDIPDLDAKTLGRFDVVLFLGVLYHVKDPLTCIETLASLSNDQVVVETVTAMDHIDEPVMRYYLDAEMNLDASNFWAPNKPCLENMFREFGFTRFEFHDNPIQPADRRNGRVIMHAWRSA